jgi:phosphoenolpyruvate-protein kinase (PTS system EI component)
MTSILPFEETDLGRALSAVESPLFQIRHVLHSDVPENSLKARIEPLADQSIAALGPLCDVIREMRQRQQSAREEVISEILEKFESLRGKQLQELSDLIDGLRSALYPATTRITVDFCK